MTLIKAGFVFLILIAPFGVSSTTRTSLAQGFPVLDANVATDSARLNIEELNAVAAELDAKGVTPLILFVEADVGDSLAEAESYFGEALNAYGLAQGEILAPDLFAIFVGTRALPQSSDARPLFFKLGPGLESELFGSDADFERFDTSLQNDVLIPRLVAGEFSEAFGDGLEFLNSQLVTAQPLPTNPPTLEQPAPEQEPSNASSTQPVSPSNPSTVTPEVTIPDATADIQTPEPTRVPLQSILVLGSLIVLVWVVMRLRKRSSPLQTQEPDKPAPRQNPEQKVTASQSTLSELSALLIDLNSADPKPGDAYLPDDMTQQSDMVLLQGLLAEERPQDLQGLQAEYRQNVLRLQDTTQRFAELQKGEGSEQAYADLLSEARAVERFSLRLSQTFQNVQQEVSGLEARVARLDARLMTARAAYETAKSGNWPDPALVFAPLAERRDEAQSLAAKKPLVALRILNETETKLSLSEDAVARLAETEKRLLGYRLSLESNREQGYLLQDKDKRLAELEQNLDVALGLLQQGEPKILDAQMDEVVDLTDKLIDETKATVALHSSNETRLSELLSAGESVKILIDNAALAFDAVDDFAPDNWRDIRGNGTEAQKAAERAFTLYEEAQTLNRLDGAQNFEGARAALAQAFAELEQAKLLCEAIHARLSKLREAQNTAREQLRVVEEDIEAHRQMLRQSEVDKEVSDAPAELLSQASELLTQAKPRLSEAQPDWLSILSLIQRADALCDEALNTTRSEQDAMQHRRVRLASEQKEAETALERVMTYARVHTHDLQADTLETLQRAQAQYQQAQEHLRASETHQDAELASSLDAAAAAFDSAEQSATEAFVQAEQDFEALDSLRASAAERVAAARASYDALRRLAERSGLRAERSLYALEADLPNYQANLNKDELESLKQQAQRFEERVKNLASELEEDVRAQESALRTERERLLAAERRRRAAHRGRQNTTWGSRSMPRSAPLIISAPQARRPSRAPSGNARRIPRATTSALPTRRSAGRSGGGGWGGKGRSGGGGW